MILLMAFQLLPFSAFAEETGGEERALPEQEPVRTEALLQGDDFYSVTFARGDNSRKTQLVRKGTSVDLPADGDADAGWFLEDGSRAGENGSFTPVSDVTLFGYPPIAAGMEINGSYALVTWAEHPGTEAAGFPRASDMR